MKIGDIGIGTDIEEIERFYKNIKNKKLLQNIFTQKELDYCFSKIEPCPHLAARFAGKEALVKALSKLQITGIKLNQIEILDDSLGVPHVFFLCNDMDNITAEISLSHSEKISIAFALVFLKNHCYRSL